MMRLLLTVLVLAISTGTMLGQGSAEYKKAIQKIEARIEPAEAKPGQTVNFVLEVQLTPPHLTYPVKQPFANEQTSSTKIELPDPGVLIFVEPVTDPAGAKTKPGTDPAVKSTLSYYPEGTTWRFPAVVSPTAQPGDVDVSLKLFKPLVCNAESGSCFPPKTTPAIAKLKVIAGNVPVEAKYQEAVAKLTGNTPPTAKVEPPVKKSEAPEVKSSHAVSLKLRADGNHADDMDAVAAQLPKQTFDAVGFWTFVLTGAVWGFVTLLTPCVFPMVPITVSVFLKQSEKKGTNALMQAIVYTGTIIFVLGIAAVVLLSFLSRLSVNPYMNLALGSLFVVLSLSLFGLFDLTLPSFLVNFTAKREGQGGYTGTVFMALSFTMVSFTCVAPFLGGFGGIVASQQMSIFQLFAGGFAFAAAFASPFFFLALFPSLLKKLPKSGGWLNTIKVVMGFLELAAALKFFRTAELRLTPFPAFMTYDFVLSLWVVIFVVAGLYLLGVYRLPHDHGESDGHIGPFKLLTALFCVAIGLHLAPGLFGGKERNRPNSVIFRWVDSFLLPEPSQEAKPGSDELTWSGDLRRSLDDARARGGFVFVDFTGVTCSNCRLNENNIFTLAEVKEQLARYTRVQLYTDTIPANLYDGPVTFEKQNADAEANYKFQEDRFSTIQLPLYVILKPETNGKVTVVKVYDENAINNVGNFLKFLQDPLKQ